MFRLGYDAFHNGWVFAFVGIISAIIQGGLIGKLVKLFGEPVLVITGGLLFAVSLFAIPFVGPAIGVMGILSLGALTSIGQALSAPTLTSLASKSAAASQQGGVLGAMQSAASLARAVGPALAAFLIYSTVAHVGFDGRSQNMSDTSILRTFWTAAAIQFISFLIAVYFARAYGKKYSAGELAEGT